MENTINNCFDNWLNFKKIAIEKQTFDCYKSKLDLIKKYCHNRGIIYLKEIDNNFIFDYISFCKVKRLTNRTINKHLILIGAILKFFSSSFELPKLKENQKHFEMIASEEMQKIKSYLKKIPLTPQNTVLKISILLLIETGARINEVLNIKKKNINFSNNSILLDITKTKQQRYVFITNSTKRIILDFLKNNSFKSEKLLFNFRTKKDFNYRTITRFLDKIKKDANIPLLHPHMFRHTFATTMLNHNAPIYHLQKILGHSRLSTTEVYLHADINILKCTFEKCFIN